MTDLRANHLIYHAPRMGEMGRIAWAHTVGSIGSSLISLFVPIYLFKLGFSLPVVLSFFMMQNIAAVTLQYPAAKIVGRIGANRGMAIAQPAGVLYYCLLLALPHLPHAIWTLALIATVWSCDRTFYWLSFHSNFSKARAHEKTGQQVSMLNSLVTFMHSLAPAIGGIVASAFGIKWVYVAAIALLLVSAFPLWHGDEVVKRRPVKRRNVDFRKIWRDPVSNFFNGMTSAAELFIWPLIIFFLVKSYAGVGVLSSVIAMASIIVALYVGRREETRGEAHYMRRGLLLESITNIIRPIVQNTGHVAGVNFLSGIGRSLYVTPYMTRYYRHADDEPRLEYVTIMEIANAFGIVVYMGAAVVLSLYLPTSQALLAAVILAVPASFGTRLIR